MSIDVMSRKADLPGALMILNRTLHAASLKDSLGMSNSLAKNKHNGFLFLACNKR
jgi:hypothetical protein